MCSSLLPPATMLAPWSQPCSGRAPLAFNSNPQAIFLGKSLSLISDGVDLVCHISPFFICGNGKCHSRIFHNSARVLFCIFKRRVAMTAHTAASTLVPRDAALTPTSSMTRTLTPRACPQRAALPPPAHPQQPQAGREQRGL